MVMHLESSFIVCTCRCLPSRDRGGSWVTSKSTTFVQTWRGSSYVRFAMRKEYSSTKKECWFCPSAKSYVDGPGLKTSIIYSKCCMSIIYYVWCFLIMWLMYYYILVWICVVVIFEFGGQIQIIITLGEFGIQIQLIINTSEFSGHIQIINENSELYTINKWLMGIIK